MSIASGLKLLPHLGRAVAARMDLAVWLGVATLVLSALAWAASLHMGREADIVSRRMVELRHRFEGLSAAQAVAVRAVPSLPDFYDNFPAADQVPVVLKAVHEAAGKAGFDLTMADYREAPVIGTPLGRYDVSLHVKASYPQLRTWLAEIMNEWPTLALEDCTIKRENVLTPTVEAQLQFAFFHRSR